MTDPKLISAIEEQLMKLELDTGVTSESNFVTAQKWEAINTRLGLGVVLISGIVSSIGALASLDDLVNYKSSFLVASTILASVVTVCGSVLTFLKPSERASRYREFGNKLKTLRNEIRIYRTVSLLQEEAQSKATQTLLTLAAKKEALNSDNPPISRKSFIVARKQISERSNPK